MEQIEYAIIVKNKTRLEVLIENLILSLKRNFILNVRVVIGMNMKLNTIIFIVL